MSEARPITNVTDFVCGACWNSFSKLEKGVNQGDHVICPHCSHKMPIDQDIVATVNAAGRGHGTISSGFKPAGAATLPDTMTGEEIGFPDLDPSPGYGWMPPDLVGRSLEPAGFVVGEADDVEDFDFNEPTLRPDQSHEGLMAQVRGAPTPTALPPEMMERSADLPDGPTSRERRPPSEPELAADSEIGMRTDADAVNPIAGSDDQGGEPAVGDGAVPPIPGESDAEAAIIGGDWKLRALGLTYNFHGLDALLGRAASKSGQAMQVSIDGTNWKDFDSFFHLYKSGYAPSLALEKSGEPGSAPMTPSAAPASLPSGAQPALARGNRQTMNRLGSTDTSGAGKPDDKAKASPGSDKGDALSSGRTSNGPAAAAGRGIGPNTSPSRTSKMSASKTSASKTGASKTGASASDAGGSNRGLMIAVAVALIAVAAVGLLSWQGLITIPGLK